MLQRRTLLGTLAALLLLPLVVAAQTPPQEELVWPLPPDPPRIRYAGSLRSERDIGKSTSFFGRMRKGLLGEGETMLTVNRPYDLHVSPSGLIYVSNGTALGVLMFDPAKKEATVIRGVGAAAVAKSMGITGDAQENIWIADATGRRVVVLDNEGDFVRVVGGPDVLLNPVDVALSPAEDRIYVSDSYLHQVLVFDREGALIKKIGRDEGDLSTKKARKGFQPHNSMEEGSPSEHPVSSDPSDLFENRGRGDGEFRYPSFLSVGGDGTLYVTDAMNFRIQAFTAEGEFIRQIGQLGDRPGSFARPKGTAVDSDGHLYVVDAAFNNIQIFSQEGRLLLTFGEIGNGPGQIWMPLGMAMDSQDRIFVADRFNNRLQVFQYLQVDDQATEGPSDGG